MREKIRSLQPRLAEIAREFDASAAQLAIAFVLTHPSLATALIGVTRIGDLDENLDSLRLLASDLSQREIGSELYLSFNTVKAHTRSIFRKLGVSSRAEAVARGRELGLL